MPSKFSHCFVYNMEVIATPYSYTLDMMDNAVTVCSHNDNVNQRTARLLSEMCLYWSILTDEISTNELHSFSGYTVYAIKRFYSLAYRIETIWGEYATKAIFETMGFIF